MVVPKWVIALCVLIAVWFFTKRWQRHPFWDQQWVSRGYRQKGVLHQGRPPLEVSGAGFSPEETNKTTSIYQIDTLDLKNHLEVDQAIRFLDQHFLKHYLNTQELLNWLMNPKPEGNLILKKKSNKEWLGTISTRDLLCRVDKTIYPLGYVDFLSVHQNYRNQRLAIRLIGATLEKYPRTSFIFKKEDRPLPFDTVCEYQYFSKMITKTPYSTRDTLEKYPDWTEQPTASSSYQLYGLVADRFAISESHSLQSWTKFVFQSPIIYRYARLDTEKVGQYQDFLSFFVYQMKMGTNTVRVAEILYLCCRKPKQSLQKALEVFEFFARQKNCDVLVGNTLGDLEILKTQKDWLPSKKTYLHFYNLGVTKQYPSHQVFLT